MARAQGSGVVRTTERRMLAVDYRKVAGVWTIENVASQTA
jgi:hypothetical protein